VESQTRGRLSVRNGAAQTERKKRKNKKEVGGKKKSRPLVSSCGLLENARYARGWQDEPRASDTRDPEAWPMAFCLARIDGWGAGGGGGGDGDGKRMKRGKRDREGSGKGGGIV